MFWLLPSGVASISWRPQERWLLFWVLHCVFTSWCVPSLHWPLASLTCIRPLQSHFVCSSLCLKLSPLSAVRPNLLRYGCSSECWSLNCLVFLSLFWTSEGYWLMPLIWALGRLRHNGSWDQGHFGVHGELEACSTLDCLRKHKQNSFPEV